MHYVTCVTYSVTYWLYFRDEIYNEFELHNRLSALKTSQYSVIEQAEF